MGAVRHLVRDAGDRRHAPPVESAAYLAERAERSKLATVQSAVAAIAAACRAAGRTRRRTPIVADTLRGIARLPGMRRRVQVGLNKGEAHHALKRAINFHQRGELRD